MSKSARRQEPKTEFLIRTNVTITQHIVPRTRDGRFDIETQPTVYKDQINAWFLDGTWTLQEAKREVARQFGLLWSRGALRLGSSVPTFCYDVTPVRTRWTRFLRLLRSLFQSRAAAMISHDDPPTSGK